MMQIESMILLIHKFKQKFHTFFPACTMHNGLQHTKRFNITMQFLHI